MAQLDSTNIVNGNIIETADILQLYDALTAGGGTTGVYNISISGSLTGSATSSSFAQTASYVVSSSYALTASYAVSASYALSSSRAISSSYATDSFTSVNATYATALLSPAIMPSGSNPTSNYLSVAAGSITMTGSLATTATSDALKNKILGQTLFINATIFNTSTAGNIAAIRAYTPATGQIQIQTAGGTGNEFVLWTAMYVPS